MVLIVLNPEIKLRNKIVAKHKIPSLEVKIIKNGIHNRLSKQYLFSKNIILSMKSLYSYRTVHYPSVANVGQSVIWSTLLPPVSCCDSALIYKPSSSRLNKNQTAAINLSTKNLAISLSEFWSCFSTKIFLRYMKI